MLAILIVRLFVLAPKQDQDGRRKTYCQAKNGDKRIKLIFPDAAERYGQMVSEHKKALCTLSYQENANLTTN
jgi:hypothetical protein